MTSKPNRHCPPPSTASTESDYAFTLTRTAVAQICNSIGFTAAEAPALLVLSDIATRYLRSIAKSAADSANSACRTQSNLVDTIAAVEELSSVNGFPGAWRVTGSFLNSSAVKEVVKFSNYSEEIPFAKPLPRKIFAGSGKGLINVGTNNLSCADSSLLMPHACQIFQKYTISGESYTHTLTFLKILNNIVNNEYIGGERKHIPKWLPVMPVIEKEEEIGAKKGKEIWGFCGKIEETEREMKGEENDKGEKERKAIELPLNRGGKVRFKIGSVSGMLGGGVCSRRGGIGKRVLCENRIFDDENHQNKNLRR